MGAKNIIRKGRERHDWLVHEKERTIESGHLHSVTKVITLKICVVVWKAGPENSSKNKLPAPAIVAKMAISRDLLYRSARNPTPILDSRAIKLRADMYKVALLNGRPKSSVRNRRK